MDPAKCESFDPLAVPTVAQLLNELDQAGSTAAGKEAAGKEDEYELTSMKAAVECFHATFWDALDKECKEELGARARDAAAAPTVEW